MSHPKKTGSSFLAPALLAAAVVVLVGVAIILGRDEGTPPPPIPQQADDTASPVISGEEPAVAEGQIAATAHDAPTGAASSTVAPAPEPAEPERAEARTAPSTAPRVAAETEPAPRPEPGPGSTAAAPARGLEARLREGQTQARRAADRGEYTLQVLSVTDRDRVREAFKAVQDPRLVALAVDGSGGRVYRLLWGFYPTRDAARAAADSCPSYFPRGAGWPYTPPASAILGPPKR